MNKAAKESSQEAPAEKSTSGLKRLYLLVQWILNLVVLAALAYVLSPLGQWVTGKLTVCDELDRANYIVVLGGDHERAVEAANLYRSGWAPKVIISSTETDCDDLAGIAADYGVASDDIMLDPEPTRTRHHPGTVAELDGVDPKEHKFIVVTSRLHTARARACFRSGGYKHLIIRYPMWEAKYPEDPGLWKNASQLPYAVYETMAWGMYRIRGWI